MFVVPTAYAVAASAAPGRIRPAKVMMLARMKRLINNSIKGLRAFSPKVLARKIRPPTTLAQRARSVFSNHPDHDNALHHGQVQPRPSPVRGSGRPYTNVLQSTIRNE